MIELATKQQAMAALKKHGCTYEDTGEAILVDAPVGYLLRFGGMHCSVAGCYRNEMDIYDSAGRVVGWRRPTRGELWDAVIEAVSMGIVLCPDPDCDVCLSNGAR